MANVGVFESGYEQGVARRGEQRAHKQAMSDLEFQEKHNEIQGMIDNLQTRLSTIPDKTSTDYLKLNDQLAQALQQRDEHWRSLDHPNAILKFGKMLGQDLKFSKKAEPTAAAPPVYGQSTMQMPASTTEPVVFPAQPAYQQTSASSSGKGEPGRTTYDVGPLAGQPVPDMLKGGNIDVNHRIQIKNADGSGSSIFSVTVPLDKDENAVPWGSPNIAMYALVPGIDNNGKFFTPDGKLPKGGRLTGDQEEKAAAYYNQTKQQLGIFSTKEAANDYAKHTHAWTNDGTDRKVYTPSYTGQGRGPQEGQKPARISTSTQPGVPAATLPGMESPAGPTLPTGPAYKVQGPQTPAQIRAQAEALQLENAGPLSPDEQADINTRIATRGMQAQIDMKMATFDKLFPDAPEEKREQFKTLLTESMLGIKPNMQSGKWDRVPGKLHGKPLTLLYNEKEGIWKTQTGEGVSDDDIENFIPDPKPSNAHPARAWKLDASGKPTSVLLDPNTNQEIPGSEDPNILPPAYLTVRLSQGVYHWVDENNQVHETPETRTTSPVLQRTGGQVAPSSSTAPNGSGTPPTHADAGNKPKAKTASSAAAPTGSSGQGAGKDRILGTAKNPALNNAEKEYGEAVKLASLADQVAAKPDDAINQKRLAVALERVSAGRFTVQALDYIIKAGWGNTIEQWAKNPSTGALPTDVLRQLVDGAHENLEATKKEMDTLRSDPTDVKNQANKLQFPKAPDIGTIEDGDDGKHKYVGGDPTKQENWPQVTK